LPAAEGSWRVPIGESFDVVLDAARTGAEWAITELYRDLQPAVVRYLRARAPGEHDDLASEVWLGVAGGLARFHGDEAAFRRYVFTLAHRRVVDHWRARARDPHARVPRGEDELTPDAEDEAIENLTTSAALDLVRTHLPPDQADVVLLRVVAGLTADDVARIVGKRAGTVRVLQHRGLRRLARVLDRERVTR
jgi:RNA polymerase sigma-70 factor, ECF subfamily